MIKINLHKLPAYSGPAEISLLIPSHCVNQHDIIRISQLLGCTMIIAGQIVHEAATGMYRASLLKHIKFRLCLLWPGLSWHKTRTLQLLAP